MYLDFPLVMLALSSIVIGLYLFTNNPFRLNPLRDVEVIGVIKNHSLDPKRKITGSLNWVEISKGDSLFNGDEILTTQKSSTTILLKGGTELFVAPESLIKLEFRKNNFKIELVKGKIDCKKTVGPPVKVIQKESGKVLNLSKGASVASRNFGRKVKPLTTSWAPLKEKLERKTSLKETSDATSSPPSAKMDLNSEPLGKDEPILAKRPIAEPLELKPPKPVAPVTNSGPDKATPTNLINSVSEAAKVESKKVLPKPISPADLPRADKPTPAKLTSSLSEAVKVEPKTVLPKPISPPDLPRADKATLTKLTSSVSKATKIAPKKVIPKPIPLEAPEIIPHQVLAYTGEGRDELYKIRFIPHPEAKKYIFEAYSDADFKKAILKVTTSNPEYVWKSNRTGKYYYRIRFEDTTGRQSPWSEQGTFIFPISPLEEL